MNKRIKLINEFERRHKMEFEDGESDCVLVENQLWRLAPLKDWMGTKEEWKQAKKEEKEMDKNIKCYVCEFIKELRQLEKNGRENKK